MQLLLFAVSGLIPWLPVAFGLNSTIASVKAPPTTSSHFEIIDRDLYEITNDSILFSNDALEQSMTISLSSTATKGKRQKEIWDFISTFDSFKTSSSFKNDEKGKPTLENFKYIILPIWWSDYDITDPSRKMDPDTVVSSFEKNQPYYIDMSWGKMPNGVTWESLPQELFDISSVSPSHRETASSARNIISQKGFTKGVHYDGICLMYYSAQDGPFKGNGGVATVNGELIISFQEYIFTTKFQTRFILLINNFLFCFITTRGAFSFSDKVISIGQLALDILELLVVKLVTILVRTHVIIFCI